MKDHLELKDFFIAENYVPQVSVDCAIFGFHNNQLKILLPMLKNLNDVAALPGGMVLQNEGIDEAAKRILELRTGLTDIYLEQFRVFGDADRSNETMKMYIKANNISNDDNFWATKRFISIGYYALVDFEKVVPTKIALDDSCEWYDIEQLPNLGFDHAEIIQKALKHLRLMLDYELVGFNLLPETFTIAEVQALYETILGKKLHRSNFQKKILDLDILERLEKKVTGTPSKSPYLYRLKTEKT